jgi:hypothetical protein
VLKWAPALLAQQSLAENLFKSHARWFAAAWHKVAQRVNGKAASLETMLPAAQRKKKNNAFASILPASAHRIEELKADFKEQQVLTKVLKLERGLKKGAANVAYATTPSKQAQRRQQREKRKRKRDSARRADQKGQGAAKRPAKTKVPDQRAIAANSKTTRACTHFAKGRCKWGDKCKFSHDQFKDPNGQNPIEGRNDASGK